MRRNRNGGRLWLLPLVMVTFAGVALVIPRLVEGLPQTARGKVVDAYTGQPIAGAIIRSGDQTTNSAKDGTFELGGLGRAPAVSVEADGYAKLETDGGSVDRVALRPAILAGGVFDATDGRPVSGATVTLGDHSSQTGIEGIYRLPNSDPSPAVLVKAPGYERLELHPSNTNRLDIKLNRQPIRAIYLSSNTLAYDDQREKLFQSLAPNGLNAVVLDMKTDRGRLTYRSTVPMARELDASPAIGPDVQSIVGRLKKANIYLIARVVVFKDNLLARAHPELAIKNKNTGKIYVDSEGQAWADPFRKEVWDYNAAIAEELATMGFDEIQFDYARFPIDGTGEHLVYSVASTSESRPKAITSFLTAVADRLRPHNTFVSLNVFGYVIWNSGELGYGQDLEQLAPVVDYLSPTLYPSTFGGGLAGYGDRDAAINAPYEVVRRSLEEAKRRVKVDSFHFRPWLQYFDDYAWQTGKRYDAPEISAEIRATNEAGASGWMMWDPTNLYARGGFPQKP